MQIAARRHATVLQLLEVSALNVNAEEFAALNKYVLAGVSHPMPAGLVFYTVHA